MRLIVTGQVLIITAMESACAFLDALPSWERDGDKIRRFKGGYGCRIGVTRWAIGLDDRWGTGVWLP